MKLLITLLVLAGLGFGIYNLGQAVYGWFEMSSLVKQVAEAELPALSQAAQHGSFGGSGDRLATIRAAIMKGAAEHGVPLRVEDVVVSATNNVLDVKLNWGAPVVTYQGKAYVELPLTVEKSFSLAQAR